ncbi:MAG: flagellar basal body rod protein FlgC [Pseudomonadota bacterium]
MALNRIFDIAGSAMAAQSTRLNTTASNIANADSANGDATKVYRARHPVFQATAQPNAQPFGELLSEQRGSVGVAITGIVESNEPLAQRYQPGHPDADENGNVYVSNVNAVEEMVNMLSASRSYQSSVEIINTTKELVSQTLTMGNS